MPEYSGYINPAESKANPTLDWSSVINDVQSTLVKQEQQREAKRQTATKEANDLYNQLSKVSTGQSQTENEFITNAAYQAKKNLADVDKLYRSGKIKANEYANIRGNMSKMFTDINDSVKGLQDDYKKYLELSQSGNLSAIADYNQNQKGKAFDLSNKKLYIDPMSGKGYLATVIDNKGNIDKENLIDPSWLKTNQSYYTPKVDVLGEVTKYTKDLGKFEHILKNPPAGGIWTIDNVAQNPKFNEWLETAANAVASDPVRMASILTDYAGDHSLTSDPKNTEANKIVMQRSLSTGLNTPVLTDKQKEAAKNEVKNAILVQVDQTMKQQENTWHGFAPHEPKAPKEVDPSKMPYVGEPSYINKGNTNIGKVVPISGVSIKRSPGVVEQVNRVGVSNGKLFMTYTVYNGAVGMTDDEAGTKASYKDKQVYTVYEDKDRNKINERLRFIGNGFSDINSAKSSLGPIESKSTNKKSEYTNLTETNKGTLGLKNGKWYNIKTGKIAQ